MDIVILTSRAKCADRTYCDRLIEHLRVLFPDYDFSVGAPEDEGPHDEIMAVPVLGAAGSGEPFQERPPQDLLDDMTDAVTAFDLAGSWRLH
jgi:hypothetical protein